MIFENDFLMKLKDFGLNSYESKLWIALLSRGVSTAGELSDISNVPRSRTYDVLESLERKGFITLKLGKPIKYVAVTPTEVVERVKKKVNEKAASQMDTLTKLKSSDVVKELNTLHEKGMDNVEPSDLSGSLKGRSNMYDHFALKLKNAKNTVRLMTTEQGLVRKADELKNAFGKNTSAKVKIIAPITKNNKNVVKELSKFAEVKNADNISSRFVVVDGNELMFMLTDDEKIHPTYDSGVWVNSNFFCQSLENLFDNTWDNLK